MLLEDTQNDHDPLVDQTWPTGSRPFPRSHKNLFTMTNNTGSLNCKKPNWIFPTDIQKLAGGGKRDRTDDLLLAKQALSQLSYAPVPGIWNQESGIRTILTPH
jgi:hypothetical protein